MARKARPRENPEARYLASRIQDARRRGYSTKVIADSFGMNERTVRKILSGQTSGTRTYNRFIPPPPKGKPNPSIVRVDIAIGENEVRTINAKVPTLPTAKGVRAAPTPFDVFRLPDLNAVAVAEAERMQRRYLMATSFAPHIVGIRPIVRRDPTTTLYTVTGRYTDET